MARRDRKRWGVIGRNKAGGRGAPATALARYARLEALGEYRDGRSARAQEVIVSFGRETLTLSGPDETPVAHWALGGIRRIDGPAGEAALRLTPDPDGDERLVLTDPQMIEAIAAVCPDLDAAPPPKGGWLRLIGLGAGGAAALAGLVWLVLPALADALAPLVPPERERQLGAAVVERLIPLAGGPGARVCTAPEGAAALARLTARLTDQADLPFPAEVRVVKSPQVNAFAAPGGQVVILSGLIESARSPEQVAAVLAHELGHVAARDPLRGALRAAGAAGLLGLVTGDALGGAVAATMAEAALGAAYTRELETAADAYAHALFAKAGLPASALAGFFDQLAARGETARGLLRHFASHPDLAERAAAARAADVIGGAAFRPALSDADWIALRQICD